MLEWIIVNLILRPLRFKCATCGDITLERDYRGRLCCRACFCASFEKDAES